MTSTSHVVATWMAEHSRQRDAVVRECWFPPGIRHHAGVRQGRHRHGSELFALLSLRFVLAASRMWLILWWRCRRVRRDGARHDPMLPPIAISLQIARLRGLLAPGKWPSALLRPAVSGPLVSPRCCCSYFRLGCDHHCTPARTSQGVVVPRTAAAVVGAASRSFLRERERAPAPRCRRGVAGGASDRAVYVVNCKPAVAQVGSLRATT